MKIERRFTDPSTADGWSRLFVLARTGLEAEDGAAAGSSVEMPEGWSQLAIETFAKMAFCRDGVPMRRRQIPAKGVPSFLWAWEADPAALDLLAEAQRYGAETSARQVFERIAGALAAEGWRRGIFASDAEALAFYDELRAAFAAQVISLPPADWAGLGLDWAYGLTASCPGAECLSDEPSEVVSLAADVPGAAELIRWQGRRDYKRAALAVGSARLKQRLQAVAQAAAAGDARAAQAAARRDGVPEALIASVCAQVQAGLPVPDLPVFDADPDGEADRSLAGAGRHCRLVLADQDLTELSENLGRAPEDLAGLSPLWQALAGAIWEGKAPELVLTGPLADWAVPGDVAASSGPEIRLNLLSFAEAGAVNTAALQQAVRLCVLVSALSGNHSVIAPTNLAALLMALGHSYDSDAGRALAGALMSVISAGALLTSAGLAAIGGQDSADDAARLAVQSHRHSAFGNQSGYPRGIRAPQPLARDLCPDIGLVDLARRLWDQLGAVAVPASGLVRLTVPASVPAQDLVLDCQSYGAALVPALVVAQLDADGERRPEVLPAVPAALAAMGYSEAEAREVLAHILGHRSFGAAPFINHTSLIGHGFSRREIARLEAALDGASHISQLFTCWRLGSDFCQEVLGIPAARMADPGFDLLAHLGFTADQIAAANRHILGAGSAEGAPLLREADLAVFDCARPGWPHGLRALGAPALLRMLAALRGQVAGEIGLSLSLPAGAAPQAGLQAILAAHEAGVTHLVLSRADAGLLRALADDAAEDAAADGDDSRVLAAALKEVIAVALRGEIAAADIASALRKAGGAAPGAALTALLAELTPAPARSATGRPGRSRSPGRAR